MNTQTRTVLNHDYIGGIASPPVKDEHATGIGVAVWYCPHCEEKHLTISTIVDGIRQSVSVHGAYAMAVASAAIEGMASA